MRTIIDLHEHEMHGPQFGTPLYYAPFVERFVVEQACSSRELGLALVDRLDLDRPALRARLLV